MKKSKQSIRSNGFLLFTSGIILAIIVFWMGRYNREFDYQECDLRMWATLLLVPMFVCIGSGTILIIDPCGKGGSSLEIHNH